MLLIITASKYRKIHLLNKCEIDASNDGVRCRLKFKRTNHRRLLKLTPLLLLINIDAEQPIKFWAKLRQLSQSNFAIVFFPFSSPHFHLIRIDRKAKAKKMAKDEEKNPAQYIKNMKKNRTHFNQIHKMGPNNSTCIRCDDEHSLFIKCSSFDWVSKPSRFIQLWIVLQQGKLKHSSIHLSRCCKFWTLVSNFVFEQDLLRRRE